MVRPSRKTVARTGMRSPGTAFAAYAPPSMTGDTFATGIRPIGAPSGDAASTTTGEADEVLAMVPSLVAVTIDNLSAGSPRQDGGVGHTGREARGGHVRTENRLSGCV